GWAPRRPSPLHEPSDRTMLSVSTPLPEEGDGSVLPSLGLRPPDRFGHGLFLEGADRFSHLGGAAGFFSLLTGSTSAGSGAVVMSASDPTPFVFHVARAVADGYGWAGVR